MPANSEPLYDPDRHVGLAQASWNENAARAEIQRIADDARKVFSRDKAWPTHPNDRPDSATPSSHLYFGAAGVVWALDYLARVGACEQRSEVAVPWTELI